MEDADRVYITRMDDVNYWQVISNPSPDFFAKACDKILQNTCNDYVEYKNCGVYHRMVRVEDLNKYGIDTEELSESSVLTREALSI